MFAVGAVLAGKYRIDRILGRGGMGVVLAATHQGLAQRVALKVLLPELLDNPEIVQRFAREARNSAQLRGEHVCRVFDVGALDDGAPYFVMELLEGRDLATLLKQHGTLAPALACDYVLQAARGVAEAHALGIVHRDLKPANLFLTTRPDGTPLIKVLDFGIAKAHRDTDFSLTSTATVLGSPGYMSPEQLRSTRSVDPRSDLWSLGVILYELVAGRPPFEAASITELALKITLDAAPPLAAAPPGFEPAVMRCLAKEPDARYADVAAFAQALAPFAGPSGPEVANAIARVLAPRAAPVVVAPGGDVPPTLASTGYAAGYAMTAAPGAPYAGGATPAPGTPLPLPLPAAPPTTMRSAASAVMTARTARTERRRWGMIAGVASTAVIAGVVAAMLLSRGGGRDDAPIALPPRVDAAVAVESIDAAVAATVAVDAAVAPAPVDAAVAPVVVDALEVTSPPDAAAADDDGHDRTHQRRDRPRTRPRHDGKPDDPEDFLDSRF